MSVSPSPRLCLSDSRSTLASPASSRLARNRATVSPAAALLRRVTTAESNRRCLGAPTSSIRPPPRVTTGVRPRTIKRSPCCATTLWRKRICTNPVFPGANALTPRMRTFAISSVVPKSTLTVAPFLSGSSACSSIRSSTSMRRAGCRYPGAASTSPRLNAACLWCLRFTATRCPGNAACTAWL